MSCHLSFRTVQFNVAVKGAIRGKENRSGFETVRFNTVVKDKVRLSIRVRGFEIIQFDVVVKGQLITLRNVSVLGLFCLTQL